MTFRDVKILNRVSRLWNDFWWYIGIFKIFCGQDAIYLLKLGNEGFEVSF